MSNHSISSVRGFLLFVFIGVAPSFTAAKEIYLKCNGINLAGISWTKTYSINEHKKLLIENSIDKLKIVRWENSIIIAQHRFRYNYANNYDVSMLKLNRISGDIEISFLRNPIENEIKNCLKERKWGCKDLLVMDDERLTGLCETVERKF